MDAREFSGQGPVISSWKIMLGITMVSILLIFVTLSFMFLRQSDGFAYRLPAITWINTGILVLSSLSFHRAQLALRKSGNVSQSLAGLRGATFLGLTFLAGQAVFFWQLSQQGINFQGAPSGTAIYVLAGLHAFHMLAGFLVLILGFWRLKRSPGLQKTRNLLLGGAYFWHFLGILWIYLVLLLFIVEWM